MPYEVGERDLAMLQYKFIVEWADGSEVRLLSLLSFILFPFILFDLRIAIANVHIDAGYVWWVTPWATPRLRPPSA
jgi:hypothetical protein